MPLTRKEIKLKAVILVDQYDNPETLQELENSLASEGIECLNMDWRSLLENIYNKRFSESFLLYYSAEMRIDQPKKILEFHHENDFAMVYYEDFPIIINPDKIFLETYRFYTQKGNNNFHLSPNTEMGRMSFKKPSIEPPRILMHTSHRLDYLKMTINSLFYSLVDHSVPISLMLNASPPEVIEYAKKLPERYPNMEILYIDKNPIYAGINILLQYYDRPKRFIAMEDDIILPQITRSYFPHWPYLFVQRLDQVDIVGWMCDSSNRSMKHVWPIPPTPLQHGWYKGSKEKVFPIMGQCFATTWEHYIENNEDETYISRDENLIRNATKYTTPFIKPYHIGWNQFVDGHKRLESKQEYVFDVVNFTTGVNKRIDIRDIRT